MLLTVILALALASTPMIHAFGQDPRRLNTFVAHVPFVWLPAVLVLAALLRSSNRWPPWKGIPPLKNASAAWLPGSLVSQQSLNWGLLSQMFPLHFVHTTPAFRIGSAKLASLVRISSPSLWLSCSCHASC